MADKHIDLVVKLLADASAKLVALGLPKDLFFELGDEKYDWSFVVIVGSLIELSVKDFLVNKLSKGESEKEGFQKFIRGLPLEGRTGVFGLIEGLGLLDVKHINFIRNINELRNSYAHNVRNLKKTILQVLEVKDSQNIDNFYRCVAQGTTEKANNLVKGDAYGTRVLILVRLAELLASLNQK